MRTNMLLLIKQPVQKYCSKSMIVIYLFLLQFCVSGLAQPDNGDDDDLPRTTIATPTLPDSWQRINRKLSENGGSYHCYVRCMGKCVTEEGQDGETSENKCAHKCQDYNKDDFCASSDSSCWSTCRGVFQERSWKQAPPSPENITVSYIQFPQPTPRRAELSWSNVPGAVIYVVKHIDLSDDDTVPQLKVSTINAYNFIKPNLCSIYAFAVAAASPYGVSQFSKTVILDAPTPVVPSPSYAMLSAERVAEPFTANPDDPDGSEDNTTVVVLVAFTPPPNWNLSGEITRVDANVHMLDAGSQRLSFSTEPVRIPDQAKFEVRLPGSVADTLAYCKFMFTVEKMFTKCNDEEATLYPPYAYNPKLNQNMPGLLVQINCKDIKNSACKYNPAEILPSCGYKDVTTDVIYNKRSGKADISVNFVSYNDPYSDRPVLWYNVTYGEGQKGTNTSESILFNLTTRIGGMKLNNDTRNFTIPNLDVGKVYVIYICTVYDGRAQNIIGDWNELQRYAIDLTTFVRVSAATPPVSTFSSSSSESQIRTVVTIVMPLLIAVVAVAALAAFYFNRKCRGKKIDPNSLSGQNGDSNNEDARYVTMKKRYDHWELPRRRLHIDKGQKLGSGAFGAVYMGKIEGVLTKNRMSVSVLAENWMQAENCEVAVKMVPAYADEMSKSDFLKEINLMKQLGYHERLVNMLACVTADDPLCLIVEYCSEGDLLGYLRKRRNYMIQLQEKGLDINNIADSNDVDFDRVLCKKDLISFAWQISVGLEYLCDRGYIHRDVAARNILVTGGKRAKIGDFGLCRYSCNDPVYLSKGGRLPIKWMALEAIKHYEFTTSSDVWSYGVLLFEIVTLGGSPYPGIQPQDMEAFLESGRRMEQPDSCPYELYEVMLDCWREDPEKRPTFARLREGMRLMLEHITEDYYYTGLSKYRDYYNAAYQQDEGEICSVPPTPLSPQPPMDIPPTSRNRSISARPEWSTPSSVADGGGDDDQSARPSSPSDTISFDDSVLDGALDNNVFDPPSPPSSPTIDVVTKRKQIKQKQKERPRIDLSPQSPGTNSAAERKTSEPPPPPPPLPPRLTPRRLSSVGSADEAFCASPAFIAARRHDSTSSEQALLSPPAYFSAADKHGPFPKFFKFTTSTSKLAPLPEAPATQAEETKISEPTSSSSTEARK